MGNDEPVIPGARKAWSDPVMTAAPVETSDLVQDFPEYVYACTTARSSLRSAKQWCTSAIEEEFPLYAAALKEKQSSSKTTGRAVTIEVANQLSLQSNPQLGA